MRAIPDHADTIAAIATPAGPGGLGVLRLSGPRAWAIGQALFIPRRAWPAGGPRPWRLRLGRVVEPGPGGETIDEALAAFFRAPHSYTSQDCVELSLHGGPALLLRALQASLAQGCRLARPGEFTLRAFLGGRLDLAQAEAVAGLIAAQGRGEARLAYAALAGGLGERLAPLRAALVSAAATVEAGIDFPEDVAPAEGLALARTLAEEVARPLAGLLADSRKRRVFRAGAAVVICGRPNVGKSSLFNAILGRGRALISQWAGTTRDCIEESFLLGGAAVRLTDTAGLGAGVESAGPAAGLDALGRAAAREALDRADLLLVVLDGSQALSAEDRAVLDETAGQPRLIAINKADLGAAWDLSDLPAEAGPALRVSAKSGVGLTGFLERLAGLVTGGEPEPAPGEVLAGDRQAEALERVLQAATRAAGHLGADAPAPELASLDLAEALSALGEVDGLGAPEEVFEAVFSQFCVGK
ncbi:MAG: tRNA modification GTPase [Pseudomonadota bacterium]